MKNSFKDLQQGLLLVFGRLRVLGNHDLVDDQEEHSLKGSGDLGLVGGCRDVGQHRELLKNLITFHTKQSLFFSYLDASRDQGKAVKHIHLSSEERNKFQRLSTDHCGAALGRCLLCNGQNLNGTLLRM